MNQEITEEGIRAEEKISLLKLVSTILPNELLFSLFYFLAEWKQKITLVKLCKSLNATDQKVIRDHLNMLLRCGLLVKMGEQYQISAFGKQALQLLNEAVGNIHDPTWIVSSYSEETIADVTLLGQTVIPAINAPDESRLVCTTRNEPSDQKTLSDRGSLDEKTATSSESTVVLGGEEAFANAA